MIVCSCNRITEQEVRDLARAGAATPEKAYACLGADVECGCCVDYAQEIIDQERCAKRAHLRIISSRAA